MSKSTSLPPRVKPGRTLGKSKGGRRKLIEREKMEKERLNGDIESCTDRLIDVLSKGGVAEHILNELRKEMAFGEEIETSISLVQADTAVNKAWTFATCYPSIDVKELVSILGEIRSLLCDSATLASKPVRRRLEDIRNDPKADPEVLEEAEKKGMEVTGVVTKVNVNAYKTRALSQIMARG